MIRGVAPILGHDDVVGFGFTAPEGAEADEVGVLAVEGVGLPVGVDDVDVCVVHEVGKGLVFKVRKAVCGRKFTGFDDARLGINARQLFGGNEFGGVVGAEAIVLAFVARVLEDAVFLFEGADVVLPYADIGAFGQSVWAVAVDAPCELY